MKIPDFIYKANEFGVKQTPFVFLIDFEMRKPIIFKLEEAAENSLYFDIKGISNFKYSEEKSPILNISSKRPISLIKYQNAFNKVIENLKNGNTYLLNLTFPSKVKLKNENLEAVFNASQAPYKLLYKDLFTLFSPECFVEIKDNKIYSYPMKGTIDASITDAEEIILNDEKEIFEHNTIVDLIRNDLSMVSENVKVTRYRYIDKIRSREKTLLQVSSEIQGELPHDWNSNIGDILIKLLPAGSISGAPKKKTVEIIKSVENEKRGYYTGIFGIFDGVNLDSGVNIRYIEKSGRDYIYRSGGGITALSDCDSEYQELIDKVYVPVI